MTTTTNGSIENPEISITEQVTIMVVTTAIEFACGFGIIALFIFGWIDILDGSISLGMLVALPLSLVLTLLTGYKAMLLICRPERAGFLTVFVLAVAAAAPVPVALF
jgi:uncharacterized membrane protein